MPFQDLFAVVNINLCCTLTQFIGPRLGLASISTRQDLTSEVTQAPPDVCNWLMFWLYGNRRQWPGLGAAFTDQQHLRHAIWSKFHPGASGCIWAPWNDFPHISSTHKGKIIWDLDMENFRYHHYHSMKFTVQAQAFLKVAVGKHRGSWPLITKTHFYT